MPQNFPTANPDRGEIGCGRASNIGFFIICFNLGYDLVQPLQKETLPGYYELIEKKMRAGDSSPTRPKTALIHQFRPTPALATSLARIPAPQSGEQIERYLAIPVDPPSGSIRRFSSSAAPRPTVSAPITVHPRDDDRRVDAG